jgi:hypothetical protein
MEKRISKRFIRDQASMDKNIYIDNDANVATLGAFYFDADGKTTNLTCAIFYTRHWYSRKALFLLHKICQKLFKK